MSRRFSVLTCVLAPICAVAQTDVLVVFLDSSRQQPAAVVSKMKEEVSTLLRPAGVTVEFRELESRRAGESFDQFVVVKWNGACDAATFPAQARNSDRLAFAHVANDRILPFVEVECRNVNRLLAGVPREAGTWHSYQLMGRAVGRLLAHEIYHFLTQRRDHDQHGIGKSHFQTRDLLAESVTFMESTRAQMQKPAPPSSDEDGEEATGR